MDWKKHKKQQAFIERRKRAYRQVISEIGQPTKENLDLWEKRFKELEKGT